MIDRVRRQLAALPLAALAGGAGARAAPTPVRLRLGLVPYLTPRQMLAAFDPLRDHLEHRLGLPVALYTAPSLRAFAHGVQDGSYDIAFVPAHLMRLAGNDWGWTPLVRRSAPLRLLLMQRQAQALAVPDDLVGTHLAVHDAMSLSAYRLVDWLAERGLRPGRHLTVDYLGDAPSLLAALERPEVTAVAIADASLSDMAAGAREELRPLADLGPLPAPGYIAAPGMAPSLQRALVAAMTAFGSTTLDAPSLARAELHAPAPSGASAADPALDRAVALLRVALSRRGRINA